MVKSLGKSMPKGPMSRPGKDDSNKASKKVSHDKQDHLVALYKTLGTKDDVPDLKITHIPVYHIQRGQYQPRNTFHDADLEDLAESIRAGGVIQPLVVREILPGKYELIAGERRWRAARIIDLENLPCIVRNDVTDKQALSISLIENLQRKDLNVIDEAEGYGRLMKEFNLTHMEVANAVGRQRSTVTNILRLLSLSPIVRDMLREEKLEMGHGRALLPLTREEQEQLAQAALDSKLSVREVERLAKQMKKGSEPEITEKKMIYSDEQLERMEDNIKKGIGEDVQIRQTAKGKICITFRSLDAVEKLLR